MLFKLARGVLVVLVLTCCGCQKPQSGMGSAPSKLGEQHMGGPPATTVMVYYFHRTARCFSCLSIEANIAQVIEADFPQQITDGRLIWMPFNLDDPGGDEFRKEFDLTTNTLIVARTTDDNSVRYKKLEDVWRLLGDPEGFSEYVKDEISKFMNDK